MMTVTTELPPALSELKSIAGPIEDLERDGGSVKIAIAGASYVYSGGGELDAVFDALAPAKAATVGFVDRVAGGPDHPHYAVYWIAADGRLVRSYEQFIEHWADNRRQGYWVFGGFALLSLGLILWGALGLRATRE